MTIPQKQTAPTGLALFGGQPLAPTLSCPVWPSTDEETARGLAEVYYGGNWSFNGPIEQAFAHDFAKWHGAKHGIFMMNGTVTLQCALGALGIEPGDEVIVPALTWLATAMAPYYLGATPVFVDVEPTTLCMNPQSLEAAITNKTRAIIPVHLYGSMADVEAIGVIAQRYNLRVIEDCAHAHGGKWNGHGLGSWGDIGSFSFQQSKVMTCGEGGVCITNDDALAERLHRSKHIGYAPRDQAKQPASRPPDGLTCNNFRATEFQAIILQNQLKTLEQRICTYNMHAARLTHHLETVPGFRVQAAGRLADPQSYYGLGLIYNDGPLANVPPETILAALAAEGLNTGVSTTYGPVYHHILFNVPRSAYHIAAPPCSVTETLATKQTLVLAHQWLGADEKTIELLAAILMKLVLQADYLQDWGVHPRTWLSEKSRKWRTNRKLSGTGVLGDLGTHMLDLLQSMINEVVTVSAHWRTVEEANTLSSQSTRTDDCAALLVEFAGGALGQLTVSRASLGYNNAIHIQIQGSAGALQVSNQRPQEVQLCSGNSAVEHFNWTTMNVPEDTAVDSPAQTFVQGILNNRQFTPNFDDGLSVQRVLAAAEQSTMSGKNVRITSQP